MKATGIIRRIDDLGRIVLPRELRRTLRLKEGDPMEIFVEDGNVVLKKYDETATTKDIIKDLKSEIIESNFENKNEIFKLYCDIEELLKRESCEAK